MAGQIHSFLSSSTEDFVSIFDHFDNDETSHRVFISRLPQRRLVEYLDVSDIECYWLTDRGNEGSLEPSYQKIMTLIKNRFSNHKGSVFLEGIEWLSSLQGFDEEIAQELKERAISFVNKEQKRIIEAIEKLKLSEDLINFEELNSSQIIKLGESGIKSKEDLANLDSSELYEILINDGIESEEEAGKIIMSARAHWFEDNENIEE